MSINSNVIYYLMVSTLLFISTGISAQDSDHVFGGKIWLTTNYIYHGVSSSDNNPAIQAELDYSHSPSGFYAYIWGSNIDFNDGESDIEIDYGAGFSGSFDNDLEWDAGIVYYSYPDSNIKPEYDYFDIYAGVSYTFENIPLTPTLGTNFMFSPEYFGKDGTATYFETNIGLNPGHDFILTLHVGYQYVSGDETSGPEGFDYADYSVSLAREFGEINAELSYNNTIDKTDACGNTSICDGMFVFTLSYSF